MCSSDFELQAYFDTETGVIILVPYELDGETVYDLEAISRLPAWEQEMAEDIKAIYENEGRYRIIPMWTKGEAYEIMVNFAKQLADYPLAEKLFDALDGRGAFKRFRNVLREHPTAEDEWCKFN